MHHHIPKGQLTQQYLSNTYNHLKPNGYYILSDEFLPDYINEADRAIKVVIWYAHIIASGLAKNQLYLAQEEAKTCIDDLTEGHATQGFKTIEQIDELLKRAPAINAAALSGDFVLAENLAKNLLEMLTTFSSNLASGDETFDLSRGDYKICDSALRKEIKSTNFIIEASYFFGSSREIGGMTVYLLRK